MSDKNLEKQLLNILKKYLNGTASKKEVEFLNLYYEGFENTPEILITKTSEEKLTLEAEMQVEIMNRILSRKKRKSKLVSFSGGWYKMAAAASVLLIASVAFYLQTASSKEIVQNTPATKQLTNDAAPGGNKAILTLSDGSTIILDSANNGTLTRQGNIKIIKLNDGQLAYNKSEGQDNVEEVLYNTISTPRGGQYQLVLSDGSQVWLNAESSLRFPAIFSGSERKVELTGEGYFEVAHNAAKPFIVTKGGVAVQVLGTHFNVNAYEDENAMKITLLEGAVKVMNGHKTLNLIPGQQAKIKDDLFVLNKNVNIDEVMAWKNGDFVFEEADIQTIMRQIARWYDIDVVYNGDIPDALFAGKISRDVNASVVLNILSEGGIHFKIVGSKVIVNP